MSITYEIAKLTARYDAMIKVEVPAKQGRKAYSYMREGGEGEKKKPSGNRKKIAIAATVGGLGLAAALGTAAAMKAKKNADKDVPTKQEEDGKPQLVAKSLAESASKKAETEVEEELKSQSATKDRPFIALLPPAKEKTSRIGKKNEVVNNGTIIAGGSQEDPKKPQAPSTKKTEDVFDGIKFGEKNFSDVLSKYEDDFQKMIAEGKVPKLDQTFEAFLDEIDESEIPNSAKYKARLALEDRKSALEKKLELVQAKDSALGFDPTSKQEVLKFLDKSLSGNIDLRSANNESKWNASMSKVDAEAWAKDSVLQDSFYHGTSEVASTAISQDGFRLDKFKTGKIFGESVYLTEDQGVAAEFADKKAPSVLEIKVNVKKVYNIKNADKGIGLMSDFYEKEAANNGEAFEKEFKAQLQEELMNRAVKYRAELAAGGEKDGGKRLKERAEKDPVGTIAGITRQVSFIKENMGSARDAYAQAFSRTLEKQGYDAMRIEGLNYLMVFNPKNITVVKGE